MTKPLELTERDNCCQPGDITVTKVPTGYLIGRALPELGPGPWWEYVTIVSTFTEAATRANELARVTTAKAWLHLGGDDYELLP